MALQAVGRGASLVLRRALNGCGGSGDRHPPQVSRVHIRAPLPVRQMRESAVRRQHMAQVQLSATYRFLPRVPDGSQCTASGKRGVRVASGG